MRRPRAGTGVLLLALTLSCARLPEQTADEFFAICMANHGHQIEDIEIHFDENGFADGFGYQEVEVQGDASPDGLRCLDGVQARFGPG